MEPTSPAAPSPTSTRDEAIRGALEAMAANDLDRAIELAQQVDALEPNSNIGLHLVGLISLRLNEPAKAIEAFEAASRLAPDVREHIEAVAIVYSRTGRLVDGLYYGKLATAATQDTGVAGMLPGWLGSFDQAFYHIGDRPLIKYGERLLAAGKYAEAADTFRREVELDSRSIEGWRGFTKALHHGRRHDDAVVASRALVSLTDRRPEDLSLHGLVLAAAGQFDEALVAGREAEALEPDNAAIAWCTVQSQGRRPDADAAGFAALVESWGSRFRTDGMRPAPADPVEFSHRRARVGVMSGHWAHGDGLDLIVPVIELLDRRGIELFVYADGLVDAPLARRLRARSNTWQDLTDLDAETASFVVRNDELDVLIDLDDPLVTNHAPLIAQTPAPIMLALHGDLQTALAMGFTGVLGDAAIYPADDPRVGRIEGGLACQPADLPPLDPSAVRRPEQSIVFGTLAERWQIGAVTIGAWRRILDALPEAVLLLDHERLGGAATARQLADQLPASRVRFVQTDATQDYLTGVDLLLDPIGNRFADGLVAAAAQGTAGITCRSRHARANLAAGWLDRVGLPELVADGIDDYVAKATAGSVPAAFTERVIADRDTAAAAQAARLMKTIATLVNTSQRP